MEQTHLGLSPTLLAKQVQEISLYVSVSECVHTIPLQPREGTSKNTKQCMQTHDIKYMPITSERNREEYTFLKSDCIY